jgi:hypothetical protein
MAERSLVIISDYRIEGYIKRGYNKIFAYYNPLIYFDTLYFIEPGRAPVKLIETAKGDGLVKIIAVGMRNMAELIKYMIRKMVHKKHVTKKFSVMGRSYILHIYRTLRYEDLEPVFENNKIDCIRVYDMFSYDLADKLSRNYNVPIVASIH